MLGINCLKDAIFKKYRINCLSFSTLLEVYSYHEPFYVPKKKNLTKCIQLLPSKTGFYLLIQYLSSMIIASAALVSKGSSINLCTGKNELNLQIHKEKLFGSLPLCFLKEYSSRSAMPKMTVN